MHTWYVVGLMSGTSLDGLDVVYVKFYKNKFKWSYCILDATTYTYHNDLIKRLRNAHTYSIEQIAVLDHELGTLWGNYLKNKAYPIIDFIASHGHTVLHNPRKGYTLQIGNPADIAKLMQVPVITDFRRADVAYGGNGAPLVPFGEKYLFNTFEYPVFLNLGGIANFSFHDIYSKTIIASDIVFVNIPINDICWQFFGLPYDKDGRIAQKGKIIPELLKKLQQWDFLNQPVPKSLGREQYEKEIKPILEIYFAASIENVLHTYYHFVAYSITQSIKLFTNIDSTQKVFVTGGGAHNTFLIDCLEKYGKQVDISYFLPNTFLIDYKEALIFAFLGLMRWLHHNNTLKFVTGATQDTIGGAIWLP
ncbi:MAG: anhydro-N-acetylmuramic acid kinase [Bacteroidia bacterium]|nr:anhydro-N-acetylmuramic acid kinase [Bacteroidia bacterium]